MKPLRTALRLGRPEPLRRGFAGPVTMWPETRVVTDRLMTYDELAEALGRSGEAVRALVIRKRWRRTLGNDGRARIAVPEEALETRRSPSATRARSPSEARPEAPAEPPPSGAPSEAPMIALLHARIAE